MYPFNSKRGQTIQTDASGVAVDQSYLAHYQASAEDAVATSNTGVHAAMNLSAAIQEIIAGITDPAIPRNLISKGNVSGITGTAIITGTNFADEEIEEEFELSGASAILGAKAFKTITKIDLPIQTHTPVAQVETVAISTGADADGQVEVTITSANMPNSPKTVYVDVVAGDTASQVATKIRAALALDEDIDEFFTIGGTGANITITVKTIAADDATLAFTVSGTTGVTVGASGNTTAGVAGTLQVETVTVTAGASANGTLIVTITAANMQGSPKAVNVEVTTDDDTAAEVAAKVRAALTADEDVAEFFTVSGAGANIILTAKTKAANDGTMAIELTDADSTSVTFGASTNTTAGVAPVQQVETIAVTAGAARPGTLAVTVTASGMTNSPITVEVEVESTDDTTAEIATKIRAALSANEDIDAFFTIGGAGANIVLTAKTAAANDATMEIAVNTDTGVTFGSSTNTTAGVPYDTVSIGWGDILGLPYKLSHNTILAAYLNNTKESTAPTVTVDEDHIENNTIDLNSALNGTVVDAYLIV